MLPRKPKQEALSETQGQAKGSLTDAEGTSVASQTGGADSYERQMPSEQNLQFEQVEISLRQAMQQMPDIAELSRNIIMSNTPESINIQLVDQNGQAMFQPGTANLLPKTRLLLQQVAKIVDRLPIRVTITGHTDAAKFVGPGGGTNRELSAAHANATRAVLTCQGHDGDRIFQVSGKAAPIPCSRTIPMPRRTGGSAFY